MYQAVADLRGCDSCQRAKPHAHAKRVPLTPMPIIDTIARWHIDLIGPFKETKLGHRYILIVVFAFGKWTEAFQVRSETAEEIALVLHKEIVSRYPQTNTVAERINKTVIQCLRTINIVGENQSNWAELLPGILMAFRMSPSASSEFSPYHLLFDHRPVQKAPPPDVTRADPRREDQPNFQNIIPPPSQHNDMNDQNQPDDSSDTDEPVDDISKQYYDVEKLVQRKKNDLMKLTWKKNKLV
ncbi:unnamed protein product [Mytilus coruscus]|uniref:Integrase catalytic domain-containing protein n=1 Tax=Mytilus coruscus TaxID=42192 RepID=A0A6J8AXN0_MYTCO|nr:unnamed protein product [Mytilus coruscus]